MFTERNLSKEMNIIYLIFRTLNSIIIIIRILLASFALTINRPNILPTALKLTNRLKYFIGKKFYYLKFVT